MENYSPQEHRFRFAAWAAGRAYARRGDGLTVARAIHALSFGELKELAKVNARLPATASEFDEAHRNWCAAVQSSFTAQLSSTDQVSSTAQLSSTGKPPQNGKLSYGRAAKLINVYLKALFLQDFGQPSALSIDSASNQNRSDFIHPPIDNLLLTNLATRAPKYRDEWRGWRDAKWTQFSQRDYESVIDLVRRTTDGVLWKIELYWPAARKNK